MKLEKLIPKSSVTQKIRHSIKSKTWKFKTKTLISLILLLLNTEVPYFNLHLLPYLPLLTITSVRFPKAHRHIARMSFTFLSIKLWHERPGSSPWLLILETTYGKHNPLL